MRQSLVFEKIEELTKALLQSSDLEEMLQAIVDGIHSCLGFGRVVLALINQEQGTLEGVVGSNQEASELAKRIRIPIRRQRGSLTKASLRKTSDVLLNEKVRNEVANLLGNQAFSTIPLFTDSKAIGMILIDNPSGVVFKPPAGSEPAGGLKQANHIRTLLSNIASLALQRAWEHKRLKQTQGQLIRSAKLSAIGQMAAEIGHELNNYLAVVSGRIQLISFNIKRGEIDKAIESTRIISQQVEKMKRFTNGLMGASIQHSEKTDCNINDLITDLILFIKPQNKYDGIEFVLQLDDRLPVMNINRDQIQEVLFNLYSNAAEVMETGPVGCETTHGAGRITTKTEYQEEENSARIVVNDNGPGIKEGIKERLFEPGFTTKNGGHGLGLSLCRRIVNDHGGTIDVESNLGEGATFVITLPLDQVK